MLVRIINGTYAHRPRNLKGQISPFVVPVTPRDNPIDVTDEEAQRLFDLGVAEPVNPPHHHDEAEEAAPEEEAPAYTAESSLKALREAANAAGVKNAGRMNKQQLLSALNGAEEADTLPPVEALDVVDE